MSWAIPAWPPVYAIPTAAYRVPTWACPECEGTGRVHTNICRRCAPQRLLVRIVAEPQTPPHL